VCKRDIGRERGREREREGEREGEREREKKRERERERERKTGNEQKKREREREETFASTSHITLSGRRAYVIVIAAGPAGERAATLFNARKTKTKIADACMHRLWWGAHLAPDPLTDAFQRVYLSFLHAHTTSQGEYHVTLSHVCALRVPSILIRRKCRALEFLSVKTFFSADLQALRNPCRLRERGVDQSSELGASLAATGPIEGRQ
jgi:hypothetical protein